MLEGALDGNDLVRARRTAGDTEQDGGVHQSRGGVVDRLVALDDLGVLARDERRRRRLERAGDVGLEARVVVAEQVGNVRVRGRRVDEREERRGLPVGLHTGSAAQNGERVEAYQGRSVRLVDRRGSVVRGLEGDLRALHAV